MTQNVVITGANRGIGLALTQAYLQAGFRVYALCRSTSDALEESNAEVIENIDLEKPNVAAQIKSRFSNVEIDLLINNAGILRDEVLGTIDYESIQQQFWVNSVAPLIVTEALLNNLGNGSKIAFITSRMGSIADNSSGGRYGYRMSKAALNAAAMSLSRDLSARNVAVAILHPGYVQTDMVGGRGDITAEVCATRLKQRIDALNINNSGTFWHSNGDILPW